jgi:hypothetical protein
MKSTTHINVISKNGLSRSVTVLTSRLLIAEIASIVFTLVVGFLLGRAF